MLAHHGDRDVAPGLVDLAVNVRPGTPPRWLRDELARVELAAYPESTAARRSLADRHGRHPDEVLPTAGAAEAFVLLARTLRARRAVVVHPQFTEPEIALRNAGHAVDRLVLRPPFTLDPAQIPDDADLVVLGNPTNPSSVLHRATSIEQLLRPGRTVVVDEAFADCIPGERESLAGQASTRGSSGLVVVRSLTKTWGLAGLRVGYLLAEPELVGRLAQAQPAWSVSAPALHACVACSGTAARAEADAWAGRLTAARERLVARLGGLPGVAVNQPAAASFLLLRTDRPRIWKALCDKGFAVRRADTFPGLDEHWIRVAVRSDPIDTAFVTALQECL